MGKPNVVKLPVLDTLTFRITGIIGGNYIRIFFWRKCGIRVQMETNNCKQLKENVKKSNTLVKYVLMLQLLKLFKKLY